MTCPSLPPELWCTIISLFASSCSTPAARRASLLSLRLVSTSFAALAQRELFSRLYITSPAQLHQATELLDDELEVRIEALDVDWGESDLQLDTRRGGAKHWRKTLRRFTVRAGRLKKVSIRGPERSFAAYFAVDWIEGVFPTLTHLSLSRLSVASYPEVAHLRLPRLTVLELRDCHPYLKEQIPLFYAHFPGLKSLTVDNENVQPALLESTFTSPAPPSFVSHLTALALPQSFFLRLFTPSLSASSSLPPHRLPPSLARLHLLHLTFLGATLPPFVDFVMRYAAGVRELVVELERQDEDEDADARTGAGSGSGWDEVGDAGWAFMRDKWHGRGVAVAVVARADDAR
ncbi:hypothetical protein JCM21900_000447 [Sporobolomyces salmonicolor]